jgi:hypothetical protein
MIDFYHVIESNCNTPVNSIVIVQPGSAIKINDHYSVIDDCSVLFYYYNDQVFPGENFELMQPVKSIFENEYRSGTKDGKKYHFSDTQFDLRINNDDYIVVKKSDILLCE